MSSEVLGKKSGRTKETDIKQLLSSQLSNAEDEGPYAFSISELAFGGSPAPSSGATGGILSKI